MKWLRNAQIEKSDFNRHRKLDGNWFVWKKKRKSSAKLKRIIVTQKLK